jgi:hypothetical protein
MSTRESSAAARFAVRLRSEETCGHGSIVEITVDAEGPRVGEET